MEQEEPYREYRMYYIPKKSRKEEEVIKREGTEEHALGGEASERAVNRGTIS